MEIKIINGAFNSADTVKLISDMLQVKILFLENKINVASSEEEIKMREKRIKQIQNELKLLKEEIPANSTKVNEIFCKLTINTA